MQRLVVKLALQNLSMRIVSHCLTTDGISGGYSTTEVGMAIIFTEEKVTGEVLCC